MEGKKLAGLMPPAASVAASGMFAGVCESGVPAARSRSLHYYTSVFTTLPGIRGSRAYDQRFRRQVVG